MSATDAKTKSGGFDAVFIEDHSERIRLLYELEHVAMVRMAKLIVGSSALAEELVHDSFVKLLCRDNSDVDNLGAYLRRVVVNACNSAGRRTTLNRRRQLDLARGSAPNGSTPGPEFDYVWEALNALSARQRTALVLRFYEDLKIDEIAAAMETRPGTIKSLIHRGLAALKQEMRYDRSN